MKCGAVKAPKVVHYLLEHFSSSCAVYTVKGHPGQSIFSQDALGTPEEVNVKGRMQTYLCLLANLATSFQRWKRRAGC